MKIAVLAEQTPSESRVSATPFVVTKLVKAGARVVVEHDAGKRAFLSDAAFTEVGAEVASRADALADADVILCVRPPEPASLAGARRGAILIGALQPFADRARVEAYAELGLEAMAMELLPRTTRAQTMDVLSSQSNLAGYRAVLEAAIHLNRILPMMTTAAGPIAAARVFVMGAGVAGLQAIATARRLGAIVSATDVRPAAREQILSLNAKPIFVEDNSVSDDSSGYAREMSADYLARQAELVASHIGTQDIVITTALIPGRAAPRLITDAHIASMRPGSVIVDMAVESGGNVEGSVTGEVVVRHGVKIIGSHNGVSELAADASALFARNLHSFMQNYWDRDSGKLVFPAEDEISNATRLTRDGRVVHPQLISVQAAA